MWLNLLQNNSVFNKASSHSYVVSSHPLLCTFLLALTIKVCKLLICARIQKTVWTSVHFRSWSRPWIIPLRAGRQLDNIFSIFSLSKQLSSKQSIRSKEVHFCLLYYSSVKQPWWWRISIWSQFLNIGSIFQDTSFWLLRNRTHCRKHETASNPKLSKSNKASKNMLLCAQILPLSEKTATTIFLLHANKVLITIVITVCLLSSPQEHGSKLMIISHCELWHRHITSPLE